MVNNSEEKITSFTGLIILFLGNAATEKKLSISDVIYRRHFGMKSDELKLIPPLNQNGLKLVLDTPLLHQKDITDVRILSNVVQDLNAAEGDAVIIVDTFSTGALLANMLYKMKFKVPNVSSLIVFFVCELILLLIPIKFYFCILHTERLSVYCRVI